MRNKGFFWFLTIVLSAVCVYQLSFTWVSSSVEEKAEKSGLRYYPLYAIKTVPGTDKAKLEGEGVEESSQLIIVFSKMISKRCLFSNKGILIFSWPLKYIILLICSFN